MGLLHFLKLGKGKDGRIESPLSLIENSFNKVKREHGLDFSQTLKQMADHIERSADPSAAALFARFKEELEKGQPDRSILRKVWEDIQKNFHRL